MFIRFAFIALVLSALGCAKTRMQAGTDGATHFLVECDGNADCGELSCVCGVCSTSCSGDGQCSSLNDGAQCLSAPSCETAKTCAVECNDHDDCSSLGATARCDTGRCVRPSAPIGSDAGQGGSGGSDAGQAGEGGSGGSVSASGNGGQGGGSGACAALDARSDGTECLHLLGYTWNGTSCVEVNCGCEGSQCDALYPGARDCEEAYSECDPSPRCGRMDARSGDTDCLIPRGWAWSGLQCIEIICSCEGSDCDALYESEEDCRGQHDACTSLTACEGPADCAVAARDCCSCNEESLESIAASHLADYRARTCRTDMRTECNDCGPDLPRNIPACLPSTPGADPSCRVLNLDRLSCTEDVGCRVRARACCECGADTSIDNLIAVPNDFNTLGVFCDNNDIACPECGPMYPGNVEAFCGELGYCELRVNELP